MRPHLTAQDIEIEVANHFGFRRNLIVPNVWWGWGLHHEADLIVLHPSGWADEVEIKVTRADVIRDQFKTKYRFNPSPCSGHWEDRIKRVWFALPEALAQEPSIPKEAGILAITEKWYCDNHGRTCECDPKAYGARRDRRLITVRGAKTNPCARLITDSERTKLAELAAMRIWDLKSALARNNN